MVVVDPRAEEADLVEHVTGGKLAQVHVEVGLGERGGDVECALEPHRARNVREQLVDRLDSDRASIASRSAGVRERLAHRSRQ